MKAERKNLGERKAEDVLAAESADQPRDGRIGVCFADETLDQLRLGIREKPVRFEPVTSGRPPEVTIKWLENHPRLSVVELTVAGCVTATLVRIPHNAELLSRERLTEKLGDGFVRAYDFYRSVCGSDGWDFLYLHRLYVPPPLRRRGYGSFVLDLLSGKYGPFLVSERTLLVLCSNTNWMERENVPDSLSQWYIRRGFQAAAPDVSAIFSKCIPSEVDGDPSIELE